MLKHRTRPPVRFAAALLIAGALLTSASLAAADPEAQDRPGGSLGADWSVQQDRARRGVQEGRLAPLSQILSEIRRRTPGRQLDAGLESDRGRPVYRVRWAATDGRRIDYIVDAESGQILWADAR
jgi:uncharacterized membrane protein YkoI